MMRGQCWSGYFAFRGRGAGAAETAAPSWAHYTKVLEARRLGYEFSGLNGRARSGAGSPRIASIIPLFDRHGRNFRQKLAHAQFPHLRLKFELPYGGTRGGSSVVRRVPLRSRINESPYRRAFARLSADGSEGKDA